jgi:hypothetical protein
MLLEPSVSASSWEVVKGVLLTLCTAGIIAALRLLWLMRDAIQKLTHVVFGAAGNNGLFTLSTLHDLRLDALEEWRTKLNAISEIERELWEGPDRRRYIRRLRDRLMKDEPIIDTDK